jgi:hypothetical protein
MPLRELLIAAGAHMRRTDKRPVEMPAEMAREARAKPSMETKATPKAARPRRMRSAGHGPNEGKRTEVLALVLGDGMVLDRVVRWQEDPVLRPPFDAAAGQASPVLKRDIGDKPLLRAWTLPVLVPRDEVDGLLRRVPTPVSSVNMPHGPSVEADAARQRLGSQIRDLHHPPPFGFRPRFKDPGGMSQLRDLHPAQEMGGTFPRASHRCPHRSQLHSHAHHPASARRVFAMSASILQPGSK